MSAERERALVGAALLDAAVADLLLAELTESDFGNPTARLMFWAMRRGQEADRLLELEGVADDPPDDTEPVLSDVEGYTMTLECAGLLEAAGGAEAVVALVENRPALRAALAAGRGGVKDHAATSGPARVMISATDEFTPARPGPREPLGR